MPININLSGSHTVQRGATVAMSATITRGGRALSDDELAEQGVMIVWSYAHAQAPATPIPQATNRSRLRWPTAHLAPGDYRVSVEATSQTPGAAREADEVTLTIRAGADERAAGPLPAAASPEALLMAEAAHRLGGELRDATGGLITPLHTGPIERDLTPPNEPSARVQLTRTARPTTEDEVLWIVIRNSTNSLSFKNYMRFMDLVMCRDPAAVPEEPAAAAGRALRDGSTLRLPFPGVEPYRQLKVATEAFLQLYCGVDDRPRFARRGEDTTSTQPVLRLPLQGINRVEEEARLGRPLADLEPLLRAYTQGNIALSSNQAGRGDALPYLALIRAKLPEVVVRRDDPNKLGFDCLQVLQEKLLNPCFLELIWSYWHEEGMLVQTLLKLVDRFQNRRAPGDRDPLANLEIDPLRSLNGFFWGYIQDEQHRLGVRRRAHEYAHHYGISLHGKAVSELRVADRRSKFLESFHNLLYQCSQFFRQDDDTTIVADGFPVMNAIKETHYVLAQGAHNQFGDLPGTARQEMLIEQWLLARPEMREFLGGRVMVPYPEVWMDRVDAMKSLQGWSDVSVVHFRDLGVYGEQLLLSVRYGGWSVVNDPNQAANWARYWRPEIQAYLHAYRAVTGVDLTADVTAPQEVAARFLPPSVHLRNRLMEQVRR